MDASRVLIQIPYQHVQNIAPRFLCWENYEHLVANIYSGCLLCGGYSVVATLWWLVWVSTLWVSTLWWLLCGGYSGCLLWVSTLCVDSAVYSGCLLCGVYSVVATLWWLVWVATVGVYSVVATLGWLLQVSTLGVYPGCLLWVSTLWCLLCGG